MTRRSPRSHLAGGDHLRAVGVAEERELRSEPLAGPLDDPLAAPQPLRRLRDAGGLGALPWYPLGSDFTATESALAVVLGALGDLQGDRRALAAAGESLPRVKDGVQGRRTGRQGADVVPRLRAKVDSLREVTETEVQDFMAGLQARLRRVGANWD